MSPSLFLIFNHDITPYQKRDAQDSFGIGEIICLPPDLKTIWSSIPPDLPELNNYLKPVKGWLVREAKKNDYVLIQGDFGACYIMVNFAFKALLIPIYSTTKRKAEEEYGQYGEVKLVHRFKHRIFRIYGV